MNNPEPTYISRTPLDGPWLLSRRAVWFENDDGTAASLPAVLSRQIHYKWITDEGGLEEGPWGAPLFTPLSLAYAFHALDWREELDVLDEPSNHYPYEPLTVEVIEEDWHPPKTEPRTELPSLRSAQLPGFADLYFIGADTGPIKIGISVNPEKRLKGLQTGYPYPLRILALVPQGGLQECVYHDRFAAHRLHGEWFERTPELLAEIARLSATPATGSAA